MILPFLSLNYFCDASQGLKQEHTEHRNITNMGDMSYILSVITL